MATQILYDGFNLSRERGTGIATYSRVLTRQARLLGNDTGVLYSKVHAQEGSSRTLFFDFFHYLIPAGAIEIDPCAVAAPGFEEGRSPLNRIVVVPKIFERARLRFDTMGHFTTLSLPSRPTIMHFTYPLPVRVKSAPNIYTIHDLVPLRLPSAKYRHRRRAHRLLKKVASEADHIVTVSEHSRRDIVELLGVPEDRVTNTYQAIELPLEYIASSSHGLPDKLAAAFGLNFGGYLLFFGAIEPKKNVRRLIDAHRASGVSIPLVVIASRGWENEAEMSAIEGQLHHQQSGSTNGKRLVYLDHLDSLSLIDLIRGARAIAFPSLYEGFGLPVLEAMTLGTPVLTSNKGALPEIAGDAALFVDPYDVDDISRGITKIVEDGDLRRELVRRGRARAEFFSLARYRERLQSLYAAVG